MNFWESFRNVKLPCFVPVDQLIDVFLLLLYNKVFISMLFLFRLVVFIDTVPSALSKVNTIETKTTACCSP